MSMKKELGKLLAKLITTGWEINIGLHNGLWVLCPSVCRP